MVLYENWLYYARTNNSILDEIKTDCSVEALIAQLKHKCLVYIIDSCGGLMFSGSQRVRSNGKIE